MKKIFYLLAVSLGVLLQGSILRGSEPDEQDAKTSKQSRLHLARLSLKKQNLPIIQAKNKPSTLQQKLYDAAVNTELAKIEKIAHTSPLLSLPPEILNNIDSYVLKIEPLSPNDPKAQQLANNNTTRYATPCSNASCNITYDRGELTCPIAYDKDKHIYMLKNNRRVYLLNTNDARLSTGEACFSFDKPYTFVGWDNIYSSLDYSHIVCIDTATPVFQAWRKRKLSGPIEKTNLYYTCNSLTQGKTTDLKPIVNNHEIHMALSPDGRYFVTEPIIFEKCTGYKVYIWDHAQPPRHIFNIPKQKAPASDKFFFSYASDKFFFYGSSKETRCLLQYRVTHIKHEIIVHTLQPITHDPNHVKAGKMIWEDHSKENLPENNDPYSVYNYRVIASDDREIVIIYKKSCEDFKVVAYLKLQNSPLQNINRQNLVVAKMRVDKQIQIQAQSRILQSLLKNSLLSRPYRIPILRKPPSVVALITSLTYLHKMGPLNKEFFDDASPLEKYRHFSTSAMSNIKKAHQDMYFS